MGNDLSQPWIRDRIYLESETRDNQIFDTYMVCQIRNPLVKSTDTLPNPFDYSAFDREAGFLCDDSGWTAADHLHPGVKQSPKLVLNADKADESTQFSDSTYNPPQNPFDDHTIADKTTQQTQHEHTTTHNSTQNQTKTKSKPKLTNSNVPTRFRKRFNALLKECPQATSLLDVHGILPEEFEIKIRDGASPCYTSQYPSAYRWTDEIKKQCIELLRAGFITRSSSRYQSSILFVPKPDGTWRMCIDYRKLNAITEDDMYKLPNINDIFARIRNKKYFSSIDLKSAYHNGRIKASDRAKTAFITPWGLFQWNRLTFGFKNAPSYWQRQMDALFQHLPFVIVYVDDILVMSNSAEEHMDHLRQVFGILKKHQLGTRLAKCTFFATELEYLGHVITRTGYHPSQRSVTKALQMRRPIGKTEVGRYLGMINWLGRFIPNLAQATAAIAHQKKKNVKWHWSQECETSYRLVQQLVNNCKLLYHHDPTKPVYIQTDASNDCIGAFLFQYGPGKEVRPLEFMSKKLQGAELNWHSNVKECFAVLIACKKWYKFLCGKRFVVFSDHKNLEVLLASLKHIRNGKTRRWATFLSELRFRCRYVRGEDNIPADYLSRDILYDTEIGRERRLKQRIVLNIERDEIVRFTDRYPPPQTTNNSCHCSKRKQSNGRKSDSFDEQYCTQHSFVTEHFPVETRKMYKLRLASENKRRHEAAANTSKNSKEVNEKIECHQRDMILRNTLANVQWDGHISPALIRTYQLRDPLICEVRQVLVARDDKQHTLANKLQFRLPWALQRRIRKSDIYLDDHGYVMTTSQQDLVATRINLACCEIFP